VETCLAKATDLPSGIKLRETNKGASKTIMTRRIIEPRRCAGGGTPAVVVGLCSHGLATARALSRHGIEVYAIESDAALPGMSTRAAKVIPVEDINNELVSQLCEVAHSLGWAAVQPVLYLMNDRLVSQVARRWPELHSFFRLSWGDCSSEVLRLMDKRNLQAIAAAKGVRYPRAYTVHSTQDLLCQQITNEWAAPLVVKPAMPLGSFKAVLLQTSTDFLAFCESPEPKKDLPWIVQEWVPGDSDSLYFCAMYVDRGSCLAHIEGRKLLSWPEGAGQGTAFETQNCPDLLATSLRFLEGSKYSGPIAFEYKRDDSGRLWLIEPNIGRTEYCTEVCTANGVNFPFIEYQHSTGGGIPPWNAHHRRAWFDLERDPMCWFKALRLYGLRRRFFRPSFSLWNFRDPLPSLGLIGHRMARRLGRWRFGQTKRNPAGIHTKWHP